MNFNDDMEIILEYAHYWNWCPDLIEFQKIYNSFPNSFSVLNQIMGLKYLMKVEKLKKDKSEEL